ncbi:MAG: helix-hairpin-helix domain-containing protein [Candidatus Latescibacteria bacterium]|jgi:competence ComEA-like helix-hairpin-helix protein|nr:helix-hairpin-helix domain-containing protein [Candidatus Latescibacterota bacterium]
MFSFNRNEQIALVLLSAALLVGAVVSLVSRYAPDKTPDFRVVKGAIEVPPATPEEEPKNGSEAVSPAPTRPTEDPSPIDLNRASEADLQKLPGIGPAIARRIVAYRAEHGPFRRVEDLAAVRGIGPKSVERIRPLVSAP